MSDTLKVELKDLNYIAEYERNEKQRQANEAQRQVNETERLENETIRQNQEQTRQSFYNDLVRKVEQGEFNGTNGKDGANGQNGQDGKDGADGEDGYTPIKGTDYFTEAEKQEFTTEITNSVNQNIGLVLDTINGEEV